jgi:putative acetyltransferase
MTAKRIVRSYRPKDLDAVLSVWERASEIAHPFLNEQFIAQERHNIPNIYLPDAETWVIAEDAQVIGFVALIGNEVGALFVHPEFHRSGAGRALMDRAVELRSDLEVEVFEKNDIGRRFYTGYGFSPMHETLHGQTGHALMRLKIFCRIRAGQGQPTSRSWPKPHDI